MGRGREGDVAAGERKITERRDVRRCETGDTGDRDVCKIVDSLARRKRFDRERSAGAGVDGGADVLENELAQRIIQCGEADIELFLRNKGARDRRGRVCRGVRYCDGITRSFGFAVRNEPSAGGASWGLTRGGKGRCRNVCDVRSRRCTVRDRLMQPE